MRPSSCRWSPTPPSGSTPRSPQGKSVLFEGAQGSLLDLDHGTFPYVTSSNASSLGVPSGCGVPARMIDKYIGVVKAYTTRVGAGPVPDRAGQRDRPVHPRQGPRVRHDDRAGRAGAAGSTALPPRTASRSDRSTRWRCCTWIPSGGLKELNICSAYEIDGQKKTFFPANIDRLAKAKPIYEQMPGWDEDIGQATTFGKLPKNAQAYVRRIEEIIGKPIEMIGVGPKRSQTIIKR